MQIFYVPMCRLLMLLNNIIPLDNSYQSTTQNNFENLSVQKNRQIFQKTCEDERESGYALCTLRIFISTKTQNCSQIKMQVVGLSEVHKKALLPKLNLVKVRHLIC